jgi:hypothetical protein
MVDEIQNRGNSDPRPLKMHKAAPAGVPPSLCHTAHTTPDTPSHEDQTRIVLNDWDTLKTELTSFWPSFEDDLPHSKIALKKTMLRFHQDHLAKWKQDKYGLTYQAIAQYLNMVKEFWNQGSPVTTDAAILERPELGREPFHLTPLDCEWRPPPQRQQPLARPNPSPPWDDMQSTVNTHSQQRPDAEPDAEPQTRNLRNQYQNQTTTSNASSSSTYGTNHDPWAIYQGRGPTY